MSDVKTIKPLGDHVLVRRAKAETTKGGIILPESSQEKPQEGEVLAVGEGKRDKKGNVMPLTVKEGNQVLFSSFAGTKIDLDQENEYLILTESDILGIVN